MPIVPPDNPVSGTLARILLGEKFLAGEEPLSDALERRRRQLRGAVIAGPTGVPPSQGLSLRSPLVLEKSSPNAIGKLKLRNPFGPAGDPTGITLGTGEDLEQGVFGGAPAEDPPLPLELLMAVNVPGPEDIVRIAPRLTKAGRKAAAKTINRFKKVKQRAPFRDKMRRALIENAEPFEHRTRIIRQGKSMGELVGAPLDPKTGKRMRLNKKEILQLRREGKISVDPDGTWYLEPGALPERFGGYEQTLEKLLGEGESGKYWYEVSGAEILEMTSGNIDDATRIAGLLAVYSQGNSVPANALSAMRAWGRYKRGLNIQRDLRVDVGDRKRLLGRLPEMDVRAQEFLYEDKVWDGIKTNSFFVNLMREIDPVLFDALKHSVTVDRWVMRGLGFTTESPSARQYDFAKRLINDLAEKHGLEPQQAQAMLWVSTKSRWEAVRNEAVETGLKNKWVRKEKTERGTRHVINAEKYLDPKKKKLNPKYVELEDKYYRNWQRLALGGEIPEASVDAASRNFADYIKGSSAYVTSETLPARTTNLLPGLHAKEVPDYVLMEYHKKKIDALMGTDEFGHEVDIIASRLGVLRDSEVYNPGYFPTEEVLDTRPGATTRIPAPLGPGQSAAKVKSGKELSDAARGYGVYEGVLDPGQAKQIDAYSIIRGYLLKQEAVPWHRLMPGTGKGGRPGPKGRDPVYGNASRVTLGRTGSDDELLSMVEAFRAEMHAYKAERVAEGAEIAWEPDAASRIMAAIGNEEGLHVLNFTDTGIPDKDFQAISERAFRRAFPDASYEPMRHLGNYLENKWQNDPNGEGYIRALMELDPSGEYVKILRELESFLGPRMKSIDDWLGRKYPRALDPSDAPWTDADTRGAGNIGGR